MNTVQIGSTDWWLLFIMGAALGVLVWLLIREQF